MSTPPLPTLWAWESSRGERGGRKGLQEPRCCPEPHQGAPGHGTAAAGAAGKPMLGSKTEGRGRFLSPLCQSGLSSLRDYRYSERGPQTSSCSITGSSLEMWSLRPHPRPFQSEILRGSQPASIKSVRVSVSMHISSLFGNSKKYMHLHTHIVIYAYMCIYIVYTYIYKYRHV